MNYYLIGIKGSGMSTLACLLHDFENNVIGYDDVSAYKFTMEGLLDRNIKIYTGNDIPEIDKDTIVTYTAAINENHHEVKRCLNLGCKVIPYKDVMANLTKEKESICVCGTHGKTTTSLMFAKILDRAVGCSYFVGDGTGHGNKKSNLLVVESCEYNKHFLSYYPKNTIITNIELDHTETYPKIEDMIDSFQEFVNKTKNNVILCGDDSNSLKLNINKGYYYGFNDNNDLIIKNYHVEDNKTYFELYYHNQYFDSYKVNLFGKHLIQDAAAAIMMSILYNIDKKIIKEEIEKFSHAKRRFSEETVGNNIIIDDYAHHPTEIRVTYDSAKAKYPNKKIVAIFLPNTYSRTKALESDFIKSLSLYDKAYLMDIKCDRENQEDYPDVSSFNLTKKINNSEMISLDTANKLLDYQNTVFCFMSCANISPMINKVKELLKK